MKHSRFLSAAAAICAMLALIFDSKTALAGAQAGAQLCVATLIPSLFPFFLVSIYLTGLLSDRGTASVLLFGFLGGYPIGARTVATACKEGRVSRGDGERLLAFCSNAGPAFLFGIGAGLFPKLWMCALVWMIHVGSALLIAALTPGKTTYHRPDVPKTLTLTRSMGQAIGAMAPVCGWVIVFRVIIAFSQRWFLWLLPGNLQLLVVGLLELANGCCDLSEISSVGLRMELFSLFLGFGGLCVLLQTRSVLDGSGLRGRNYFPGKIAQGAAAYLLSVAAQPLLPGQMRHWPHPIFPLIALTLVCGYGFFARRRKMGVAFSRKRRYNQKKIPEVIPR